jgi:hypothetical protein
MVRACRDNWQLGVYSYLTNLRDRIVVAHKALRQEARALKEVVAEQAVELRLLKKHDHGWRRPRMRHNRGRCRSDAGTGHDGLRLPRCAAAPAPTIAL